MHTSESENSLRASNLLKAILVWISEGALVKIQERRAKLWEVLKSAALALTQDKSAQERERLGFYPIYSTVPAPTKQPGIWASKESRVLVMGQKPITGVCIINTYHPNTKHIYVPILHNVHQT